MLELRNLHKAYVNRGATIKVLDGLDAKLEAGCIHALLGPSGCGKSTLLSICGALLEPDQGEVRIAGQQLHSMNERRRAQFRNSSIGYVFQQFHLIPYLNVEQNVMAAHVPSKNTPVQVKKRCHHLLGVLGLSHRREHFPGCCSAGEQQRVAIARALLNTPSVLIADEPTGNLDRKNSLLLMDTLKRFASNGGLVLMATHDQKSAEMADHLIGLDAGRLLES